MQHAPEINKSKIGGKVGFLNRKQMVIKISKQ